MKAGAFTAEAQKAVKTLVPDLSDLCVSAVKRAAIR